MLLLQNLRQSDGPRARSSHSDCHVSAVSSANRSLAVVPKWLLTSAQVHSAPGSVWHFGCPTGFHPPREVGSAWPFHMDNSVLGEEYASAMEIESGAAWRALLATGSVTLPLLFDGPFARFVALRNFRAAHPDFMPAPKRGPEFQ